MNNFLYRRVVYLNGLQMTEAEDYVPVGDGVRFLFEADHTGTPDKVTSDVFVLGLLVSSGRDLSHCYTNEASHHFN